MTDTAMIQQTASVLLPPGTVAELRILDTPRGTVSGYFDNAQAFTQAAQRESGRPASGAHVQPPRWQVPAIRCAPRSAP